MRYSKKIVIALIMMVTLMSALTYAAIGNVQAATAEKKVELNATSLSLVLGRQKKLKLLGTDQKVTWTSSDPKVVRVNKRGIVKTRRVGDAVITATVGKKSYTCAVTVKKPKIVMEEYGYGYYSAIFSDGFTVEAYASHGELDAKGFREYYIWASYDMDIGVVYPIRIKDVTVKGYNTTTGKSYRRVLFDVYSAGWCKFKKDMYRYLDFDYNVKEYGAELNMAEGYLVFKKSADIDAIKYNDGTHKVTAYLY